MESVGVMPLINEGLQSKNVANLKKTLQNKRLRVISVAARSAGVAKSLQSGAEKKAYGDQSLAWRRWKEGVAISFRCSAFSTGGGRFQS
jgi:hypothetical protein